MDNPIKILFEEFLNTPDSPEKCQILQQLHAYVPQDINNERILADYEEVCLKDGFCAGFRAAMKLIMNLG